MGPASFVTLDRSETKAQVAEDNPVKPFHMGTPKDKT
jgi:hypothetical protein